MKREPECIRPLMDAGIDYLAARALRRISMTLHRWHELGCGNGNQYSSWCITRGHKVNGEFVHDDNGRPYLEMHLHTDTKIRYLPTPDRERGALKSLKRIMARYPALTSYVQGDPRGAALYIIRPSDVPEGSTIDSCYSRGIAVYK